MTMLDTHRKVAPHAEYTIYQRQPGFEYTPVMLAKVASYIVQDGSRQWSVFAFMYSLLSQLDESPIQEDQLLKLAVETMKAQLDEGTFAQGDQRTFEYRSCEYVEVTAPRWWIAI